MLARKAATIRDAAVLGGWLITTTRLAARNAARNERRPKPRERRVAQMQPRDPQSIDAATAATPGSSASAFDPFGRAGDELDAALARLGDLDRTAITLRYLQARPLSEVAGIMGVTEAAATKRVSRALAKLRERFAARGTSVGSVLLLELLDGQSRVAAPQHPVEGTVRAAIQATRAAGVSGSGAAAALARQAIRDGTRKARAAGALALLTCSPPSPVPHSRCTAARPRRGR